MIEFTCSECGKAMRVADKHAGKQGRCACGVIMTIPSAPAPAAPPPPPSPPPVRQAPPPLPFSAAATPIPPPAKGMAVCALVFGCLAVVFPPLGLVAVILGILVLASRRAGKAMATVGLVLGIVLPLAVTLPLLGHARELARQSTCMANLKSTSSAIETYKADNKSRPPRLLRYGNPLASFTATTMDDVLWTDPNADPPTTQLASGGSVPAMQSVWLLIAKDLIPQDAFTCPSDPDHEERNETGVGSRYGWTSWDQIGYGMHYPTDTASADGTGEANPAAWTDHISGSVAILADKSPDSGSTGGGARKVYAGDDDDGTGQIKPANHAKDGEAYLLANGSAAFYKELDSSKGNRPINSNCGKNGDNIYDGGNGADFPKTHDETLSGGGTVTIGGEVDTFIVPNVGP